MKIYRYFTFYFVLFSLFVCFHHFSGFDDKNILIFLTNPINAFTERALTQLNETNVSKFQLLLYSTHLIFWIVAGLIVDLIKTKIGKRSTKNR